MFTTLRIIYYMYNENKCLSRFWTLSLRTHLLYHLKSVQVCNLIEFLLIHGNTERGWSTRGGPYTLYCYIFKSLSWPSFKCKTLKALSIVVKTYFHLQFSVWIFWEISPMKSHVWLYFVTIFSYIMVNHTHSKDFLVEYHLLDSKPQIFSTWKFSILDAINFCGLYSNTI